MRSINGELEHALKRSSLFELFSELVCCGRAEAIPVLAPFEPISVDVLLAAIEEASSQEFENKNSALEWAFSNASALSELDKWQLRAMQELRNLTRRMEGGSR